MADITRLNKTFKDNGVRYIIIKSSENNDAGNPIAQGDIIRAESSLGNKAKKATISTSATCDLGVIVNSKVTIYPKADSLSDVAFMGGIEGAIDVLSDPREADSENPEITIPAGATMEIDGPIKDIKIATWTTGTWEIRLD